MQYKVNKTLFNSREEFLERYTHLSVQVPWQLAQPFPRLKNRSDKPQIFGQLAQADFHHPACHRPRFRHYRHQTEVAAWVFQVHQVVLVRRATTF